MNYELALKLKEAGFPQQEIGACYYKIKAEDKWYRYSWRLLMKTGFTSLLSPNSLMNVIN